MKTVDDVIQFMYDVQSIDDKKSIQYMKGTYNNKGLESYLNRRIPKNFTENDMVFLFKCIAIAMDEYINDFIGTASYKEKIYLDFCEWFVQIGYNINYIDFDDKYMQTIFESNVERPIKLDVVDLIKQLHPREGVTKCYLRERYADSFRGSKLGNKAYRNQNKTIINMINRLSGKTENPYHIGGQKVCVDISYCDMKDKESDYDINNQALRHYYTPNTLNPLILQENVTQVGTILEGLSLEYYLKESDIALEIAVDIWCQLSDYCQKRLYDSFGKRSSDLSEFFDTINDSVKGDHVLSFMTEDQMKLTASKRDLLMILYKGIGSISSITYYNKDRQKVTAYNKRVLIIQTDDEEEKYCFVDPKDWHFDINQITGEKIILSLSQILRID